jgi:hypothetical protein
MFYWFKFWRWIKTRFTKIPAILLFLIILFSLSPFLHISAEADEEIENIVSSTFYIEMKSATDLKINVEADVTKLTLIGKTYTDEDIKIISTPPTNTTDDQKMGKIKYALQTMIFEQIKATFINAQVTSQLELLKYENYKFYDEYLVNLTSKFFSINETINSYELINGMLDVGAQVRYNLNLKADPGWDILYSFDLGEKLGYNGTNGNKLNNIIEWTVRNSDGKLPSLSAFFIARNKNPTTIEEKEDISIGFILNSQKEIVSFESEIAVKSMSLKDYTFLPDFITNIEFVPSDSIRLFAKNNLVTWDEIYQKTIKTIQENIKNTVETSVFNQTLALTFNWDNTTTDDCSNPFDIEKMDKNPPVKAILKDDETQLMLNGISSKALFGLVNTGAKSTITPNDINFGKNLEKLVYNYNITLKMPQDIYINNENTYTWDNKNKTFSGLMLSTKSPEYKKPIINTIIEIEAETADLNLLSFFTGDTELSFGLKIGEEKNYKVTKIPEPFILPETINITYLNSDAIRLCIEENVFKEEEINIFLTNEKTIFEQTINKIITGLGAKGNINHEIFQKSLQWDSNITNMDNQEPVKTQIYSHTSNPIKFKMSIAPPGLKINNQTYKLTGLENQYVTYKIVFPNGIKISLSNDYERIYVNETKDGKQYIEITFSPEEANTALDVTITLEPSILFIIALFIPCIISFIIALILIIVIVLFRKKRRKRKMPAYSPEPMEDTAGYEDEDYYIPPPPGSK